MGATRRLAHAFAAASRSFLLQPLRGERSGETPKPR
jgi:hypothetical protein